MSPSSTEKGRGAEGASLIERLKRPAPKFGLEEFDPTFDLRHEAAEFIGRLTADVRRKDEALRRADQFAALKTELYNDIEALRLKLRNWSSRVSKSNPFFAESEFDTHAAECLDALREDLAGMIDDADEAPADHEASDGLEPGETYRPIHRSKFPYPRAAE